MVTSIVPLVYDLSRNCQTGIGKKRLSNYRLLIVCDECIRTESVFFLKYSFKEKEKRMFLSHGAHTWLSFLLNDLAIYPNHPVFHERNKYIELDCNLVCEKSSSWPCPHYVSTITATISRCFYQPTCSVSGSNFDSQVECL